MRWFLFVSGLSVFLASCAAAYPPVKGQTPDLKNFGPAPELANTIWINADQPLRLSELRGKVVLLDMWTFG